MKAILFALLFLGSSAFAKAVNHEVTITKGPYYVGARASAFNPLDSDFHSEGEVLVYMDGLKMTVEFPRITLFSTKTTFEKGNEQNEAYYYTPGNKGFQIRVGFTGDKMTWLFAREDNWSVTIADELKETGLEATPFAKMTDEQIEQFAANAYSETEQGGLENMKISRNRGKIVVTADVMMMIEEQSDDPVQVGEATLTFTDKAGDRKISIEANVEIPKSEN